jgi:hypothetical protein
MSMEPPCKSAKEHEEDRIGRILITQQHEQHTQQLQYLINPLRTSYITYKELNLDGKDNNHSSQPPKLYPKNKMYKKYTFK